MLQEGGKIRIGIVLTLRCYKLRNTGDADILTCVFEWWTEHLRRAAGSVCGRVALVLLVPELRWLRVLPWAPSPPVPNELFWRLWGAAGRLFDFGVTIMPANKEQLSF